MYYNIRNCDGQNVAVGVTLEDVMCLMLEAAHSYCGDQCTVDVFKENEDGLCYATFYYAGDREWYIESV